MKILYIDVNCKNSSSGDIVYNLHIYCDQNNIQSTVCYGRGPKIIEPNIFKFGINYETNLHALLTRITGFTGCYSYFSTKRLIRYIKKFKPDIVHIHELHAYFVNIKQLLEFLKKKKIPTVFTNHCEFLYTGKCGHAKECNKYSMSCGKCPHLREYPKSLVFDRTRHMLNTKKKIFSNWSDAVIVCPSNWLNKRMDTSLLNTNRRITIYNGIDTDIFKYKKNTTDEKIILCVAPDVLSLNKGGLRIVNIANKLIDKDYKFILVGATLIPNNLPKNVVVYPVIKDKKFISDLYSKAKCFLLLSEMETFPTTSIEAQCSGTKVIGYDVGGIKETIVDGCGVAVPYHDDAAVIKAIDEIVNENYDKGKISKIACSRYSFDSMFKSYLKIYKELCH